MESSKKIWFAVTTLLPIGVYMIWSAYKTINLIQKLEIPAEELKNHPEYQKHLSKLRLVSLVAVAYFLLRVLLY